MGFEDRDVDPTHWHTLHGFHDGEPEEMLLTSHPTLDDARTLLEHYVGEVVFYEGAEVTGRTEDRVDFGKSEVTDFQLGWLRVVECSDWLCWKEMRAVPPPTCG